MFDYYTGLITECDRQIERQCAVMKPRFMPADPGPPLRARTPNSKTRNKLTFNARGALKRVVGIELSAVTGLSASSILTIISEIGTDMSLWPTVKHVCSWLGLAPRNDISGGKVVRSRTFKNVNRAGYPLGEAFRQDAQSVARSDSAFGAHFRRMRAKLGPQQATVATAHKIARVVYHLLQNHEGFEATTAEAYDR